MATCCTSSSRHTNGPQRDPKHSGRPLTLGDRSGQYDHYFGHDRASAPAARSPLPFARIGLYLRPPVIAEHKRELTAYKTTKSAIHFALDKKLAIPLIKKLVRARMKKNDAEGAARK